MIYNKITNKNTKTHNCILLPYKQWGFKKYIKQLGGGCGCGSIEGNPILSGGTYKLNLKHCSLCRGIGHNKRTCSKQIYNF